MARMFGSLAACVQMFEWCYVFGYGLNAFDLLEWCFNVIDLLEFVWVLFEF